MVEQFRHQTFIGSPFAYPAENLFAVRRDGIAYIYGSPCDTLIDFYHADIDTQRPRFLIPTPDTQSAAVRFQADSII